MFDFQITDDGELEFNGGTGNIKKATSDTRIRQLAVCRIKSVTKNWFNENELGANLEEFLGAVNNQDTLVDVMDRIKSSISDIVSSENMFIIPKIEREELAFAVFIRGRASNTPIVINVSLDIVDGVKVTSDINS